MLDVNNFKSHNFVSNKKTNFIIAKMCCCLFAYLFYFSYMDFMVNVLLCIWWWWGKVMIHVGAGGWGRGRQKLFFVVMVTSVRGWTCKHGIDVKSVCEVVYKPEARVE